MSNRRLHIYYRHTHIGAEHRSRDPNKARPHWFTYEACLRNLVATLRDDPQGHRVSVTLMFDGTWEDFLQDFSATYVANSDGGIQLQLLTAGSDKNSALITLHFVHQSSIEPGDLIYILENDYLHQPGWVGKVFELYDSGVPFDYISLYDHRDKYFLPMYEGLTARVFHSATHHWRTAPSSCGSFICEIDRFRSDYDILQLGLPDFYFHKALNEHKGRVLLTPIPGLSTHCMEGYLSPTVDWAALSVAGVAA